MKFGKVLQDTSKYFPDKRFISYKNLKKLLKTMASKRPDKTEDTSETPQPRSHSTEGKGVSSQKASFVRVLNQELHALNSYFIGEEESMVIRIQALESAMSAAKPEDKSKYSESVVQVHGDLVALFHWVILNYAAVAKILKKCDKVLEGQPIRQTYLKTVALRQPFYSTEQIEKLAKQCEQMITDVNLSPSDTSQKLERSSSTTLLCESLRTEEESKKPCLKRMLYAIQTWRDLGDNAHTPSTVLPYSKPLPDSMKMLEKCKEHSSALKKGLKKRTHLDENAEVHSIKIARSSDS